MPSTSSLHECNTELCVCLANESPPILTNDDLYGNLPTPSVVSITSFNTPTSVKSVQTRQSTFKTDKGKKRLAHKENWVVNKRKKATKKATCFMWHEAIAKRGANEVSSCLYQYIKEHSLAGIKDFKFWSDNCAGQNRNRIVFSLYLLAAKEFKVTITHRFMEKGHTQNEGDSVHSTIERASERKMIYVPEEWYCLVRWAKAEGEPYEVKEMSTPEIMDFKSLLLNKIWNKNTNEKIQWTHIKEVKVNAHNFYRIEYKYDIEDTPKTIIVMRSGTRNTAKLSREFLIKQAYNGELSISRNKHKDLCFM